MSLGLGLGLGLGRGGTPAPFMQVTTTDTTQVWSMRLTAGATYRYDWGDGTAIDSYVGTGADQSITHTYGGAGTYTVRLWVDDLSKLLRFNCGSNSLAGSLPSFAACTAITHIYIFLNAFSGTLPSFATCTVLTLAYFYNNAFSGTLPSFASCPWLTSIIATTNAFASYATGAWAAGVATCRLDANALDLAAVDAILSEFTAGAGGRPASGTLNLSGGTNAVPTPATKAACIAALPGWTITTN